MTLLAPRDATSAPDHGSPTVQRRSMSERLARWSTRHRWSALLLWLVLVAGAVVGGSAAGTRTLTDGETGAGESGRADRQLEQAGYAADLTERVLVQAPRGRTLDPAETRAVAGELRRALAPLPAVASVGDLVRSADGRSALLPVALDVDGRTGTAAEDLAAERVDTLLAATETVATRHPDVTVAQVGGTSIDRAVNDVVESDFQRAETLSLPVTLGILLLAFGALFAAGVPVLLAPRSAPRSGLPAWCLTCSPSATRSTASFC